ncbi:hypothetical protein N9V62_00015 [Porticoccaceae bacterium]|nr:hypothetical protein [Porticoccaceae bacterium]
MVDSYRAANCASLPATISVGGVFTAQGSVAPMDTGSWDVRFSNGWASIEVANLDLQDRATLLSSFDGSQAGNTAVITVPLRRYTTHNITALNDRMTMEGPYSYVCY